MNNTIAELKQSIINYLLRVPQIDDAMNDILELVGTFFRVDRAYIFETTADGLMCNNTYEWCSKGISHEKENLQQIRYLEDLGGTWTENFDKNGMFLCQNIETLPVLQRDLLKKQSITGMLQFSIRVHDEFKGFIGFDNCSGERNWENDRDAIETLSYVSQLLSVYLLDNRHSASQLSKKDQDMQLQLEKSNRQYEELLANINCGVIILRITPSGRTLDYANDDLCKFSGKTREEIIAAFNQDILFLADRGEKETVREVLGRAVRNMEPASCTFSAGEFAGHPLWLMAKVNPVRDEDGNKLLYITYVDITSEINTRNDLENKYQLEKQKRRENKSAFAYALFNLTTGQTIEMERKSPLAPCTELMSLKSFCDDICAAIHSETEKRELLRIFNPDYLIRKYNEGVYEQFVEFRRKLPNGKSIWVKSSFHTITKPGGSDILLIYTCNDINLHKTLEMVTSYITSDDYDMIGCINFFDNSAIMLYGKNSSFSVQDGGETLREEEYAEDLNWFVNNAIVPEEREQYRKQAFIEKIKAELTKSGIYEFTVHVLNSEGVRLTKKMRYAQWKNSSDICFFTQIDITDLIEKEEARQKELRAALEDARKASMAKTEFLSRMSHDMRTPMNGILGMAELSADENDPAVLKENIRSIKDSGDYLLGLINDTLDFQRIESGKLTLESVVVNASTVIRGILDLVKPAAEKKNINFVFNNVNADYSWYVRTDPLRMKQIFINLLSNAIKFTPSGGTITFTSELLKREGMISHDRIVVSDTGIGMSEDFIQNRLFTPFSQEFNEVTGQYAGSGLGLSIVHSLVELMGGRIEVESALGKGTKFTVYMAFERVEEAEAKELLKAGSERISGNKNALKGRHILLAEDHPLNAEIARRLLEKVGCEMTLARNGQECIRRFENAPDYSFDAILMDVRMPLMDGLAATRRIRQLRKPDAASIPIIAMTANAYAEDVKNCLESGMNAHVSKPINPDKLYETLTAYIGSDKAEDKKHERI